ncbi:MULTISPECIES: hypothetical protein [Pseudomonas]|jgi:hypothetical protein|uniref:hypothetical protein n=1 Tax=Pseudomonas TaxID=286 RepID=UPI0008E83E33|nr:MULTISPECIES: hypothetical protein [Pseudomonas]MAB98029.1 hypothetical protein [Pseudomonadaceae bacterium]SFT96868.1 hypothetical protein SAMN05216264_107117 [Pseudomonas marincola]
MKFQICLAAACLAASLPIYAANPFVPVELSDQELSQLRGRYVLPGRIINFGITMSSSWQNASGQVLGANVSMQIQQNMPKPVFNVQTYSQSGNSSENTLASNSGNGQIAGGNGLNAVQGVVQSTRSAGDYNSSYNGVDIEVAHGNTAPAVNGQPLLNASSTSSEAGMVSVSPTNGGLQLAINAKDHGVSLQQLGAGGVMQRTDISSSGNRVENIAALSVMLRENSAAAGGLDCNWNQLNALRPTGL